MKRLLCLSLMLLGGQGLLWAPLQGGDLVGGMKEANLREVKAAKEKATETKATLKAQQDEMVKQLEDQAKKVDEAKTETQKEYERKELDRLTNELADSAKKNADAITSLDQFISSDAQRMSAKDKATISSAESVVKDTQAKLDQLATEHVSAAQERAQIITKFQNLSALGRLGASIELAWKNNVSLKWAEWRNNPAKIEAIKSRIIELEIGLQGVRDLSNDIAVAADRLTAENYASLTEEQAKMALQAAAVANAALQGKVPTNAQAFANARKAYEAYAAELGLVIEANGTVREQTEAERKAAEAEAARQPVDPLAGQGT